MAPRWVEADDPMLSAFRNRLTASASEYPEAVPRQRVHRQITRQSLIGWNFKLNAAHASLHSACGSCRP
jgi:hypothetical protein